MKISNNSVIVERGDKNNLPIIFIHGFPFDHYMWQNQMQHLEKEYYCISYDIRGLGKSEPVGGQFTMEDLVDDLFCISDKLSLEKPVICGLSMGGYICLRAVEKDQSAFGGLILCDTKSTPDDNVAKLKRASGLKMINEKCVKVYCETTVPATFSDLTLENNREVYEQVLSRSVEMDSIGIKGCLLAMLSRTDTTPFLEQINIPTLLICGSLDKITTPQVMREMYEKIKDSEFAIAPRAGHMSPVENPGFVNDVIEGFLRRRIKI